MTVDTHPTYLGTPEASQAFEMLQRAAQDTLTAVVGQAITVTLDGRRAVAPNDLAQSTKNVLIELQFERPLEVHHSVAVLASATDLIGLFSLTPPDDEAEVLGAESLLSLGDIISTFLDTIASELVWLQPTPRAWLANLEPVAVDPAGTTRVELPALVAQESPPYLVELVVAGADGAACPLHLVFGERTEASVLGLDAGEVEAPAPAVAPAPAATSGGAAPQSSMPAPPPREASAAPLAAAAQPPVQPAQFKPLGGEQTVGRSNSIDLIKDVPLHVSVELGRASLTVREILALGVGSVVELDRLAGEPVDVLVNDRLIARGEVVIVDESFGVRITEIFRESSRRVAV